MIPIEMTDADQQRINQCFPCDLLGVPLGHCLIPLALKVLGVREDVAAFVSPNSVRLRCNTLGGSYRGILGNFGC